MILKEERSKNVVEVRRYDHECEAGNQRCADECCQWLCPTSWLFWRESGEEVERIPREESVVIGADVGEGDEEWS